MNDLELLKTTCENLKEHFDTVHIFATRMNDEQATEETINCQYGSGNWCARYGQIHNWLVRQEEITREDARKD